MAIRRSMKIVFGALLTVTLLVAGAVGLAVVQNDYAIKEEKVTITGGVQPLRGVLARPKQGRGPLGLVVFVHGDGPIEATLQGIYRPMWESLAKAGYASLSWNKPGIDGAPGNWLDQSMEDRAAETLAAIAWAKKRPGIDPGRVGLWGGSQAGWVMPKVAARMPDLHFVIAVSPAINWLRQGRYNLLAELHARRASQAEIQTEIARSDAVRALLRQGASFEQAKASGADLKGLTADRWRFITKNYTSDASRDLAAGHAPVLLMLGGHDINVDVADTEAGYRKLLSEPGELQVRRYSDATHAMLRKDIEDKKWKLTLYAIFAPRTLFTARYLSDLRRFVERIDTQPS